MTSELPRELSHSAKSADQDQRALWHSPALWEDQSDLLGQLVSTAGVIRRVLLPLNSRTQNKPCKNNGLRGEKLSLQHLYNIYG